MNQTPVWFLIESITTVHLAPAAFAISILIKTMEMLGTKSSMTLLTNYIAPHSFQTVYGNISFDKKSQNNAPSLLTQYNTNGIVQTVFPVKLGSGLILYPMPSWNLQECVQSS